MLNLGLADALDENANLLKLGRIRVTFDPPLYTSSAEKFKQVLLLSSATISIETKFTNVSVWVDANSSSVHLLYTPTTADPVSVNATLGK